MKRIIALLFTGLGFVLFCMAQNQPKSENGVYRQEGIASWYGTEFDGRYTASGEVFDSTKFTASHPNLPFGTILTVTNLQNNKQVIVRVNDRGPFKPVRIIDVSQAAAEQLDMIATGTAPVLIEIRDNAAIALGPVQNSSVLPLPSQAGAPAPVNTSAPDPRIAPAAAPLALSSILSATELKPGLPPPGTNKRYRIQVGAFKVVRNAVDVIDTLKNLGLNPAYEKNGEFYRVVLAGIKADDVQSIVEKLSTVGFREALIREEQ